RPYFANLDGIRAVACLMVFVAHIWDYLNNRQSMHPAESWIYINFIDGLGTTGVCLFFVLSGFLITTLLLREKEATGTVSLKNFYARRILRIWPVFFLVVLLGFVIVPLISGTFSAAETGKHIPWYLLFANNFDRIASGFTGFGNDSLGVLWSVAVEEQFYLLWPLVILLTNKRWFWFTLVLIIIASAIFRQLNSSNTDVLTFHTFSVMGDLVIGSSFAWSCLYWEVKKTARTRIIYYSILILFFLLHNTLLNKPESAVLGRMLLAFSFGFLIEDQVRHETGLFRFSSAKWLSKFGIITYGFYCLHLFVIMGIQKLNAVLGLKTISTSVFVIELIGALLLTTGISILSYRFFEKPLLRLKHKFESLPKTN
ncbi:MAG: acyltransferase family protein, partial [Bacteroidia bacterium]